MKNKKLHKEKHNGLLSTEEDKKVFFTTLINPPKPNRSLKEAVKHYQKQASAR